MPAVPESPSTRPGLERALHARGIREGAYHLYGAHVQDALVIDNRPSGWVVFYSERGQEDILATYETEAEACRDLYERVTADPHNSFTLVAGPSLPSEADEVFDAWLKGQNLARSQLAPEDWKYDDVPWEENSPNLRRYFVRHTIIRGPRMTATATTPWLPKSTFLLDLGWASVGLVPAFAFPFVAALLASTFVTIICGILAALWLAVFAVLSGEAIEDWWDDFKSENRILHFGLAAAIVVPVLGAICGWSIS